MIKHTVGRHSQYASPRFTEERAKVIMSHADTHYVRVLYNNSKVVAIPADAVAIYSVY